MNNWKPMTFIATTNADRAREFYNGRLGLPLTSEDGFALVFDNHGIALRVSLAHEVIPAKYTVLGWEVADIEEAVRGLEAAGVALNKYPFIPAEANGIWDAPGGARVAWFNDPEGNVLSVSQH